MNKLKSVCEDFSILFLIADMNAPVSRVLQFAVFVTIVKGTVNIYNIYI